MNQYQSTRNTDSKPVGFKLGYFKIYHVYEWFKSKTIGISRRALIYKNLNV